MKKDLKRRLGSPPTPPRTVRWREERRSRSRSQEEEELEKPPLTPDMKTTIRRAQGRGRDEVLVDAFKIQIRIEDLSTLSGLNWLNNNIIHKLLHENYQLLLRELDREETSKQCQCMLSQPSCTYSLGCPLILTSICITY